MRRLTPIRPSRLALPVLAVCTLILAACGDNTAPEPPTAAISATGDAVTGTAEIGSTVNVYDADGNVVIEIGRS